MPLIRFDFGALALEAELLDTPTAASVAAKLPYLASAMTWGEGLFRRSAPGETRARRPGGRDARRNRLLARRAGDRHRLRAHADEPRRRVPACEPVQHLRQGDFRREGAERGAAGDQGQGQPGRARNGRLTFAFASMRLTAP